MHFNPGRLQHHSSGGQSITCRILLALEARSAKRHLGCCHLVLHCPGLLSQSLPVLDATFRQVPSAIMWSTCRETTSSGSVFASLGNRHLSVIRLKVSQPCSGSIQGCSIGVTPCCITIQNVAVHSRPESSSKNNTWPPLKPAESVSYCHSSRMGSGSNIYSSFAGTRGLSILNCFPLAK
jgi:hypothetical protein